MSRVAVIHCSHCFYLRSIKLQTLLNFLFGWLEKLEPNICLYVSFNYWV